MTESTIINGDLSCDNCPDKIRCKEQQEKKNNIIKNILNDIVDKNLKYTHFPTLYINENNRIKIILKTLLYSIF